MYIMQTTEKAKPKVGDGYETLRVRADIKARILKIQNAYFSEMEKKISVSELLREALDARERRLKAVKKTG